MKPRQRILDQAPAHEEQQQQLASRVNSVAVRYPRGSTSPSATGISTAAFWAAMVDGANIPALVPIARWDVDAHFSPGGEPAKMCVHCHFGACGARASVHTQPHQHARLNPGRQHAAQPGT